MIPTLYAVVPHLPDAPDLSVLNMPEPIRLRERSLPMKALLDTDEDYLPATVDLVVAWNADHAAHIEAVTGYGLQLGEPPVYYPTAVRWIDAAGTAQGLLPVGKVAARFHVTGCHRVEVTKRDELTVRLCCSTPWARYDDGLWHWTGHAEKVNP